jgi:hypothetical protein
MSTERGGHHGISYALGQELRDALDQLGAAARILPVISESPDILQPVLDAIARARIGSATACSALCSGPRVR